MNMWVESLGIIAAVLDLSMSLPQTLKNLAKQKR